MKFNWEKNLALRARFNRSIKIFLIVLSKYYFSTFFRSFLILVSIVGSTCKPGSFQLHLLRLGIPKDCSSICSVFLNILKKLRIFLRVWILSFVHPIIERLICYASKFGSKSIWKSQRNIVPNLLCYIRS